ACQPPLNGQSGLLRAGRIIKDSQSRSKFSVESSGYCSWKLEALREMEKNEIEAALETSRKSLAANVLSSASQMSDPSKSFAEKEEVMELARKVFKDGRDVDLEDQVISDQFQIGYSSSRSSYFRSIPDCRYFSFMCVSITGLKTCMTSGYSYIEGIEHLLLSLKQNNYEMHAFTNYPTCLLQNVTLFKNPVADLSLFQLKMGICNQDAIKQLQSMMENVNEQQKITFQDAWQCDICGSKSERGFGKEPRTFTSDVKIKSISIVGGADGTSPAKMRAFINRDGIDFSDAQSMQAIQLGVLKKAGSPIQHVIQ
ncbi:hypothetical protein HN51_032388, partial [Arachis hypogaea]